MRILTRPPGSRPPTSQASPRQDPSSFRSRGACRMASTCSDSSASIAAMSRSSAPAQGIRIARADWPPGPDRTSAASAEAGSSTANQRPAAPARRVRPPKKRPANTASRSGGSIPGPARSPRLAAAELFMLDRRRARPGAPRPRRGQAFSGMRATMRSRWSVPPTAARAAARRWRCRSRACREFPCTSTFASRSG